MSIKHTEPSHGRWKKGDKVESPVGMRGEVLRVIRHASMNVAIVRWENGHVGRTSVTNLHERSSS